MIQSTAVFLGFLFGLSIAYYLSFWSHFDIDVFQYIAIEDIIKGIAYPLRFAGIWLVIIIVFAGFLMTLATIDKPSKTFSNWIIVLTSITFVIGSFFAFVSKSNSVAMALSIFASILLSVFYFTLEAQYKEDKEKALAARQDFKEEHPAAEFIKVLLPYAFIFFPINAIIAGIADAKAIQDGKAYNYIMPQDLPKDKISTKQPYLIFLGAVSEKYIFIDRNGGERFIIDKDELPAMRIHHFDSSDKRTVLHLSACLHRQMAKPKK